MADRKTLAYDHYVKTSSSAGMIGFKGNVPCGCDCDYHVGNWDTGNLYIKLWTHRDILRYGHVGDTLPPGFCNHPTNPQPCATDPLYTNLGALAKAKCDFESGFKTMSTAKVTAVTGFNCKHCNQRNDFAAANQKDGTYVCFNCR